MARWRRSHAHMTARAGHCLLGSIAALSLVANYSCSAIRIRRRSTAATSAPSPPLPCSASRDRCGLGARHEPFPIASSNMPPNRSWACARAALRRAGSPSTACSTRCTAAASRAALRTRCAAGGRSEPGADAEGGDGGPDKRGGTPRPSKPVCTRGCGGTARGLARAAQRLESAVQQRLPRAVSDALR